MFDFSKLGDLSKVATQAQHMQRQQELIQKQQIDLLHTISGQLTEIIDLLKQQKEQATEQ